MAELYIKYRPNTCDEILGLAFFPEYEKAKESALKAYEMTFNIAERTKDKLEKKSEPTSPIIQ